MRGRTGEWNETSYEEENCSEDTEDEACDRTYTPKSGNQLYENSKCRKRRTRTSQEPV